MTKEQYEQKKQARIERYKKRTENAKQASKEAYEESNRLASVIPMGQPILIGHYSEKSDRAYRARIAKKMDKFVEEKSKADYWKQRAEAAEKNNTISSDDPEAIQKLKAKINQLEFNQGFMKKINSAHAKYIKKQDESVLSEFDEKWQLKIKNYVPAYSWEKHPFPPYALQNNNQNIAACKKRLEQLERNQNQTSSEKSFGDIKLIENVELNRIQIKFPGKPDYNTRQTLKSHGFRWSPNEMAWQRHLNNSGRYSAEYVINKINQS